MDIKHLGETELRSMKRRLDEVQMSKQEQVLDGVVSVREILAYVSQDCYLTLARAAQYTSTSKRFLRDRDDLPRYRVGKKILLFKKSELDEWMLQFREGGDDELDQLVDECLEKVL